MKKLIIFDCDGTLADTETPNNHAVAEALGECGYPHYDVDFCAHHFRGMTMSAVKAFIEEREGTRLPDSFVGRFIFWAAEQKKKGLKPIEGAVEAVHLLAKNSAVCVASNGERSLVLTSLQMVDLFEIFGEPHIYTKSQVPRGKPFPDIFLFAAAQMGYSPENCLIVEDSPSGVQAGVAANIPTIGLTASSHAPALMAESLTQSGAVAVFHTWPEIVNYINENVDEKNFPLAIGKKAGKFQPF